MKARVVQDHVVVVMHMIEGVMVLETACKDFDAFAALPEVLEYDGVLCGKTGWSSDSGRACYKSGIRIARVPNPVVRKKRKDR